jgi:hypothetical protein
MILQDLNLSTKILLNKTEDWIYILNWPILYSFWWNYKNIVIQAISKHSFYFWTQFHENNSVSYKKTHH